jgi:nitrous-oxide reductase
MYHHAKFAILGTFATGLLLLAAACGGDDNGNGGNITGGDLDDIATERGLTPEDMRHALQQYVPPGEYDEFVMFASGGHSGQMLVIGLPSMRILKTIAVFTPEPWQGYGYGADWGEGVLEGGNPEIPADVDLSWGDTHHPAISETGGEYDGRYLYIQDRANGRVAFVDLRDLRTKQIVAVPNIQTSHGGMFVTPNSEYVHVSSKFPVPQPEGSYADVSEYQEKFRARRPGSRSTRRQGVWTWTRASRWSFLPTARTSPTRERRSAMVGASSAPSTQRWLRAA